jgi:preprotein translocase subunit SecG
MRKPTSLMSTAFLALSLTASYASADEAARDEHKADKHEHQAQKDERKAQLLHC